LYRRADKAAQKRVAGSMTLLEKPTTLSGISLSPVARKVRWAFAGRRTEIRVECRNERTG
jgi:hypothetical protein